MFKLTRVCLLLLALLCGNVGYTYSADYKVEVPIIAPTLLQGFYLGPQIGYEVFRVRDSYNVTVTGGVTFLTGSTPLSAHNFVAGGFIGYGQNVYRCLYLGVEAFLNADRAYNTYTFQSADDEYVTKMSPHYTYGIALLPGLPVLDDLRAYLRLGYTGTKFKVVESISNFLVPADASATIRKHLHGWNAGVGIEKQFCTNWSYRAEYNYIRYQNVTSDLGSSFKASNYQVMLSVVYHLGGLGIM